ncbi:MAG: transposase [Phycisphaerales bacterium]
MPQKAHRYELANQARFLTFSCHDHQPLLATPAARNAFATSLAKARTTYNFKLLAWVAMPEHVHLLLVPDLPKWPVPKLLWGLKRGSSTRIKNALRATADPLHGATADPKGSRATTPPPPSSPIWQPGGGYDRNIRDLAELNEKITYIHNNPVTRALVPHPEDWPWSSATWYRTGTGLVTIDR